MPIYPSYLAAPFVYILVYVRGGIMKTAKVFKSGAHALSLDVRLITRNVREFGRVPGLRIEDWA